MKTYVELLNIIYVIVINIFYVADSFFSPLPDAPNPLFPTLPLIAITTKVNRQTQRAATVPKRHIHKT